MKQTTRKATEVSTATIGIDLGDKTHERAHEVRHRKAATPGQGKRHCGGN